MWRGLSCPECVTDDASTRLRYACWRWAEEKNRKKSLSSLSNTRPIPLNDLQLLHPSIVQFEEQHGALLVETRQTHGTRIEVKSTPRWHGLDKQDVAVPAYEQVGALAFEF